MNKKIRIAVVGCGAIAESAHIPNLINLPNVEIAGVCDINQNALDDISNKFNIERRFSSHKKLLDELEIDAGVICTTADAHAEICIDFLKAGKDVFVEKPLALNLEDAQRVLETVETTHRVLQVGYQMRHLINHGKAKEMMKNEIGQIYSARIVADVLVIKVHETILIDYMTHLFDLMRWYFAEQKVTRVCGMVYEQGDIQIGANVLMGFNDGRFASVEAFWMPTWSWGSVQRRVEILGRQGKIITDLSGPTITLYKETTLLNKMRNPRKIMPKQALNQFVILTDLAYRDELNEFINCITHNKKPNCDAKEGYMALLIADAAKKSYKTGRFVDIHGP
jgi:predicted dehydrogenase